MVQIIACFTLVRDIEKISSDEWSSFSANDLRINVVPLMINVFDEAALENSLRVKENMISQNIQCQLTAISACVNTEEYLSTASHLYAIGFDKVILIKLPEKLINIPMEIAHSLFMSISSIRSDSTIILTGCEATPYCNHLVPVLLSECLRLPFYDNVTEISVDSLGKISIRFVYDNYELLQEANNSVISMGNAKYAFLRIPTLHERLVTAEKKPHIIELNDASAASNEGFHCERLIYDPIYRDCELINNDDFFKAVSSIYDLLQGDKNENSNNPFI